MVPIPHLTRWKYVVSAAILIALAAWCVYWASRYAETIREAMSVALLVW